MEEATGKRHPPEKSKTVSEKKRRSNDGNHKGGGI